MSDRRVLLLSVLIGAVGGYVLLSPAAMVFFHLSHAGIEPDQMHAMDNSSIGAAIHALRPDMAAWWAGFLLAGAVIGAAIAGWWLSQRHHTAALHQQVEALQIAQGRLDQVHTQVVKSNKLNSLGLLSASVVHDIGNYITLVHIVAEDELDEDADAGGAADGKDSWSSVLQCSTQIRSLCDSVRRLSRQAGGERQMIDLNEPLRQAALLFRKNIDRRSIRFRHSLTQGGHLVRGDVHELMQVFVNLLQNALDAMEDGGVLTLLTSERDGHVEIQLSDTGQGIPDEIRHKVVEAFFTTKGTARGTGLGLAICSRIVEEHGGELSIDSEVGMGTTVRVVLPLADPSLRRPTDSVVV